MRGAPPVPGLYGYEKQPKDGLLKRAAKAVAGLVIAPPPTFDERRNVHYKDLRSRGLSEFYASDEARRRAAKEEPTPLHKRVRYGRVAATVVATAAIATGINALPENIAPPQPTEVTYTPQTDEKPMPVISLGNKLLLHQKYTHAVEYWNSEGIHVPGERLIIESGDSVPFMCDQYSVHADSPASAHCNSGETVITAANFNGWAAAVGPVLTSAYMTWHEFGHGVQDVINGHETEGGVTAELQANCIAGATAKVLLPGYVDGMAKMLEDNGNDGLHGTPQQQGQSIRLGAAFGIDACSWDKMTVLAAS